MGKDKTILKYSVCRFVKGCVGVAWMVEVRFYHVGICFYLQEEMALSVPCKAFPIVSWTTETCHQTQSYSQTHKTTCIGQRLKVPKPSDLPKAHY